MKIKSLELTNFRCFDQIQVNFGEQLTVLVAANGAGKTGILDAISLGLAAFLTRLPNVAGFNPKGTDFRVLPDGKKPPYMRLTLTNFDEISWDRTEKRDQSQQTAKQIPPAKGLRQLNAYTDSLINDLLNGRHPMFPVIVYYGTSRGVFDTPQRRRSFQKDFAINDGYRSAMESKTNFRRFFEYFYFLEDIERRNKEEKQDWDYQQIELKAIRHAIKCMMPEFSNLRTKVRPLRFLVDWHYNNQVHTLQIEQLSDGFRTTLAMVMDIAARMAELNPSAENILATEGVVLIDEVDLHLHPAWQQRILDDLVRTFPNVQFIVSTHSPQVISTVATESIRILDRGAVHAASPGTKGAESSRILKRIFGVDPRPTNDSNAKLLNEYLKLVYTDQWDSQEAASKRQQLDKIFQDEEPALTEADLYIENRQWELGDEEDQQSSGTD